MVWNLDSFRCTDIYFYFLHNSHERIVKRPYIKVTFFVDHDVAINDFKVEFFLKT